MDKINYIDFDDVILDTTSYNWYKNGVQIKFTKSEALKHAININWEKSVKNSLVISNAFMYLKELNPRTNFILTTCHSFDEAYWKNWINKQYGSKIVIIPVDYRFKKSEVVPIFNSTLTDNLVTNCDIWNEENEEAFFFNKDNQDIDNWGYKNKKFVKVNSLEFLLKR